MTCGPMTLPSFAADYFFAHKLVNSHHPASCIYPCCRPSYKVCNFCSGVCQSQMYESQDCCHTPPQLNFGLNKKKLWYFSQDYFHHKTYSILVMYRKIVSQDCFLTRFKLKFDARNHLCKVEVGHKKIVSLHHKIVQIITDMNQEIFII